MNLRDKIRQGLQILPDVLMRIVKTKKKGKLTVYVAKKLMPLNGIFHNEQVKCAVMCEEFKTLHLNKVVLKNILTGLHETRGDPIEDNFSNRSLSYTAYKQLIWSVFKKLGKGNRRVIPLCTLWKIRENKINFIVFEYYTDYHFFVLLLDKCRKYIQLKNENSISKS